MAEKPTRDLPVINCAENGPYLVRGLNQFEKSDGSPLQTKNVMALCRCGASSTKPFCDGTHAKIGFTDEKQEGRIGDKRDDYRGKEIVIHDNRGICSHAGHCTDGLPEVWKLGVEPWIDPDGALVEKIIETIDKCPSGALSYSIGEADFGDRAGEPKIKLSKDGPYLVSGGVGLEGVARGEGASQEHFTLCRCGGSKNKPFCDGSHWYNEFSDDEGQAQDVPADQGWHKVAEPGELADGDVKSVAAGGVQLALTRCGNDYGALDGSCPHQGGPLGEGTTAECRLRCPWHGWEFDALTGKSAPGQEGGNVATYPVEIRDDGIYVAIEAPAAAPHTISDVMIETMVNWGVTHVFGMVGHSNLGVAEAVRLQEVGGKLQFIGIRHEGAASFACSGYAKVSGRPAACLTIAGPGATNLLTGLWDAKVDRAPVIALTGQVATQVLGPGAFQEIDHASAFDAVTVFSQTVLPSSRHAELMTLAVKHAIVEQGVAHLIFPDEVQGMAIESDAPVSGPEGRVGPTGIAPPRSSLATAVVKIAAARRPAIIVGYGARHHMGHVQTLAKRLNAPVLTTFKAKGQIADSHPLAAGVLGRSGTPVASTAMANADMLIVFGASFANHTGIDKGKQIVQIDRDRMALGKFHPVDVPVWGDVGVTARALTKALPEQIAGVDQREEIAASWAAWREEKSRRAAENRGKGLSSAKIFEVLTSVAPENAIIPVDVGNNTYSFGRYFECNRQTVIMSGYLGSIGFAFPAAMGAWAVAEGRPVLSISGDGGFGQYMGEFTTAVKYGMNITHLLLNNSELGKISKEQRDGHWQVWQTSMHNPNFAEYAKLCGGLGIRVETVEDLAPALKAALVYDGPALVEVISDVALV